MKSIKITFLIFLFSNFLNAQQAVPNFTVTDLDGNQHRLYEDYLDQGKAVIIHFSAAWGPWDWVWHNEGTFEDFYHQYGQGGSGEAVVLHIEADPSTTDEALLGLTNGSQGDWTEGISYPICNPTEEEFDIANEWGLIWYPTIMLICPDGRALTDGGITAEFAIESEEVDRPNINTVEKLVEAVFGICDIDIDRNKINGTVYHDLDSDCEKDVDEYPLPYFKANFIDSEGSSYCRYTNDEGLFRVFLEEGDYNLTVSPPNDLWAVCDNSIDLSFTGTDEDLEIDFGAFATVECFEPSISITSPALIRCFESDLYVHYCNEGTITENDVTIRVVLDEHMTPISSSIPWDSVEDNILMYNIGTLVPFECNQFNIVVEMACDEIELGDEHCYSATILPYEDCDGSGVEIGGNTHVECQENVGSYDPNDKRGFPMGVGETNDILPNIPIDYQIRFQNTGTFTAFNVVVLDTLPTELDASTIRLGSKSHEYEFAIINGNILEFTFEDINLPWSDIDEPGSNGFFNFTIQQKENLPEQTRIENKAAIYFDFNDPIITNTAFHTINSNIVNIEAVPDLTEVSVFPNPIQEQLNVNYKLQEAMDMSIEVYNVMGELVTIALSNQNQSAGTHNLSVPFKEYAAGLYFVHIKTAKGNLIRKMVK